MRYPVKLLRDSNDTIRVEFPDIPGAHTFGDTKDEALARAIDALLTVIDARIRDRQDIPGASPITSRAPYVELPALEATKIELYRAMQAQRIGKAELARRLRWHLPQVDRLFDVRHASRLDQLEAGLSAIGKRLVVTVEDAPQPRRAPAQRKATRARQRPSPRGGGRKTRHV